MATPDFNDHQKSALVQLIITGGMSLPQACTQYGLSMDQLKDWICVFRRAVRQALDHQLRDTLSVQGLDLDELSRSELSGSLSDIRVDELLQTIQMGRKDALIIVTHAGETSQLWCRAGDVVDASSGSLEGEDAFYRILAIERGSIVADFAPNQRERRIKLSTPRLLLKAASSTGLRARLMQRIGDPARVFTVVTDVTARHAANFESDELDVLSLFDGARSVEQVVLTSGLPDARALEIVARFREQQLLSPDGSALALELESAPRSAHLTMSYRPFVASAAPEPARPSAWLLACGAVLCSSLGAVTALAYANVFAWPAPLLEDVAVASPQRELSAPEAPASGQALLPAGESTLPAALHAAAVLPAPLAPIPSSTRAARCPSNMTFIRGGEFMMGSDSTRPALSLAGPPHRANVSGFCLDVHEVTVSEYAACSDAGDCTPAHQGAFFADEVAPDSTAESTLDLQGALCNADEPGREQHPINCVSHAQAAGYCRAHAARLPSEGEWEFAARGAESRSFPWGDAKPSRARLNACGKECERRHDALGASTEMHGLMYAGDDGYAGTAPVGSFPLGATPEGVVDLIGNVFEWTAHGLYDYEPTPSNDPQGPTDSDSFVIRGGNFNSGIREFADPALRFAMHGESYSHGVGFRCATDASVARASSNGGAHRLPDQRERQAPASPSAGPDASIRRSR
jgi:formylglycine-generating enzyme required for sulfatase activity